MYVENPLPQLPTYNGRLVRHRCPAELAIDPRPFGYLGQEIGALSRLRRSGTVPLTGAYAKSHPLVGSANSEARKRLEQQPEHPCYEVGHGR